jgi:hypothetical protein
MSYYYEYFGVHLGHKIEESFEDTNLDNIIAAANAEIEKAQNVINAVIKRKTELDQLFRHDFVRICKIRAGYNDTIEYWVTAYRVYEGMEKKVLKTNIFKGTQQVAAKKCAKEWAEEYSCPIEEVNKVDDKKLI